MLVVVLLVSAALPALPLASFTPAFYPRHDHTLAVVLPDDVSAKEVVLEYSFPEHGVRHITHSRTLHRQQNGDLSIELKLEKPSLKYVVKYYSATGQLLHSHEGTYRPTRAVSPPHRVVRRGTAVFHDTFTGNHLDTSKWDYQVTAWGGGNGEFQMYTPEHANTYIKNGELYMKPTYTADKFGENFLHSGTLDVRKQWGTCTSDNESGCLRRGSQIPVLMSSKVVSKQSIRYGRVEVVAKLPKGDWLWPAIWMLPPGSPWKYGGWPASGEIDIMEARGNTDLKDYQGNPQGINVVYSTLHWGPSPSQHQQAGHWRRTNGGTWGDGYHTYSLDWTAQHLRIEVDNQPVFVWNTPSEGMWAHGHFSGNNVWQHGGHDAPFDGKFSLIMNVAVGGGFFNQNWINKGYHQPWADRSGNAMADFWSHRHQWQSTWHGEDVAMKVRSVKMIQY